VLLLENKHKGLCKSICCSAVQYKFL